MNVEGNTSEGKASNEAPELEGSPMQQQQQGGERNGSEQPTANHRPYAPESPSSSFYFMPGSAAAGLGNGSFNSVTPRAFYPHPSPRLGSSTSAIGIGSGSASASQNGQTPPPQPDDHDALEATMTDVHFDAEQLIVENERLKTRCSVLKRRVEVLEKAAAAAAQPSPSRQIQVMEAAQMTDDSASLASHNQLALAHLEIAELQHRLNLLSHSAPEELYASLMESKLDAATKAKDQVIAHLIGRVQSLTKELAYEREGKRRMEEELASRVKEQNVSASSPRFRMKLETSVDGKPSPDSDTEDSDSDESDHQRQPTHSQREQRGAPPGTDRGQVVRSQTAHPTALKYEPQTARPSGVGRSSTLLYDNKSPSPQAPSPSQPRPATATASRSTEASDFKFVHHITLKKQTVSRTARGTGRTSEGSPSPAQSSRCFQGQMEAECDGEDDQEELILVTPRYSTRLVGRTDTSSANSVKNLSATSGSGTSSWCLNS